MKIFNEIIYKFILNQLFNLIINTLLSFLNILINYIKTKNIINFINIKIILYYN